MSIDKAVKEWKARAKESQTLLEGLEAETREIAEQREYAHDAHSLLTDAQRGLDTVQGDKASTEAEMLQAMLTDDTEVLEGLRGRHASLTEREQSLQGEIRRLTGVVTSNTPDPSEVAALTTRLKQFSSPGVNDVVKAIRELEQGHARDVQERIQATVEQLPESDPREVHRALMELDESYRKNEGKSMEQYLADEDDKGNVQQATAMLASRLEARERRAVIAAR